MANVIFIGGFNLKNNPQIYGGQVTASLALISSPLRLHYNFLLIDSTIETFEKRGALKRLVPAFQRILRLLFLLLTRKVSGVLIFSSSGFSFIEKGLMALIAKLTLRKVIFFPRSGLIKDNLSSNWLFRMFGFLVFRTSDAVICQGSYWKEYYSQFHQKKNLKFVVLENWIDMSAFSERQFVFSGDPVAIMYLGHFYDYKGIQDFIDVASELLSDGEPIKINIYGDGPLRNAVTEFAKTHPDRCFYHGVLRPDQKSHAFNDNDIFVLPSYKEGFPNALLEAMAAGLAVIATPVGGVPSLVHHNVNGILYPAGNKSELANAIKRLLRDQPLLCELGKNARRFVSENNSGEKAASVIKNLLA